MGTENFEKIVHAIPEMSHEKRSKLIHINKNQLNSIYKMGFSRFFELLFNENFENKFGIAENQ